MTFHLKAAAQDDFVAMIRTQPKPIFCTDAMLPMEGAGINIDGTLG
jgi:hypothetical protein